jgi:Bacterial regulatory protein, Fis family
MATLARLRTDKVHAPHNLKATDAMVRAALKKTNGRISLAAAKLNMSRQALHDRVNRNPELRTFIADLDELIVDTAENVIFTAVKNGSDVNARFLLQ